MTPLIMVMGFADSMQMVSAIRIRLREGDTKLEAVKFAINVVGPACVLAHGAALLSFLALLFSESGLIRTFGEAGAMAVCISFVAVIVVLPLLALLLIRNEKTLARDHTPADGMMDALGTLSAPSSIASSRDGRQRCRGQRRQRRRGGRQRHATPAWAGAAGDRLVQARDADAGRADAVAADLHARVPKRRPRSLRRHHGSHRRQRFPVG